MSIVSPPVPTLGDPNSTEDVDVRNSIIQIRDVVNALDNANWAGTGANGLAYNKLATLNTGQIIVGNAGVPTAATASGDVTVDAAGVTAIGANKVTTAKILDANVTAAKLADAAKLGLDDGASVRRGKSIIATAESRTNTSYGTLTTPDQVSSTVLPTDGLLFVAYRAMWQSSVNDAGRAAICIGGTQLQFAGTGGASFEPQEAANDTGGSGPASYVQLFSTGAGLESQDTAYPGGSEPSTGLLVGGLVDANAGGGVQGGVAVIWAAAGTYDISVQFKATSGSVTVKNRKLWVWTMGF